MTRKTVAQATLRFLDGWREVQEGEIVRGGRLVLEYDSQRLPVCRFHVSSLARWDISVEGRFWPGGQSFARTWPGREIIPSTILDPPYAVVVPDEATEVEMWFKNTDERPGGCLTWDSRFGVTGRFKTSHSWALQNQPLLLGVSDTIVDSNRLDFLFKASGVGRFSLSSRGGLRSSGGSTPPRASGARKDRLRVRE